MALIKKIPIWLILLEVPFAYLAYQYIVRVSLTVYDASSHLAQVWYLKEYLWPEFSGFNPFNLLGFDQGLLYPSLFHYVAAIVAFLGNVEIATKLVVATSLLLLPLSIYLFSSVFFFKKNARAFLTAMILVVLVSLPGYFGADLKGLTQVGLLPSFVSLPLVFFFLYAALKTKPNWVLVAILLTAIILTHLVAAIFCSLVFFSFLISKRFTKKFDLSLLKPLLLALGLSAFFWVPFVFNYSLTSQSVHLASVLLPNLAVMSVLILLSIIFWKNKKEKLYPPIIAALILGLVVLVDALVLRYFDSSFLFEKIYNFHLYRYQVYFYILATFLALYHATYFLFETPRRAKIKPEFIVALPILVIYFASFIRSPFPVGQVEVSIVGEEPAGRFLETFNREDSYPFTYAAQNKLVQEREASWGYGLLTDSTPSGPYLGSLIKSFDPFKRFDENEKFVERRALDRSKIYQALDLFAIEQLLFLNPTDAVTEEGVSTHLMRSGVGQELVEIPKLEIKEVGSDWDSQVEKWWFAKGRFDSLLVKTPEKHKFSTSSASIKDLKHTKDWKSFSFKVDSQEKVPILVKMNHLPGWRAQANGENIEIFTASPYLMLVYSSGEIEFKYQKLWYQNLSLLISGFVVILLLLKILQILLTKKVKKAYK